MKTAHFIRPDLTSSQDLSSAALSYTTSINRKFKLEQILLKFSVAVTEKITITVDSAQGANYDVILVERTIVGQSNFVYKPEGEANFQAGDEIKVQCTNANGTGTAYLTIKTSEM